MISKALFDIEDSCTVLALKADGSEDKSHAYKLHIYAMVPVFFIIIIILKLYLFYYIQFFLYVVIIFIIVVVFSMQCYTFSPVRILNYSLSFTSLELFICVWGLCNVTWLVGAAPGHPQLVLL